MHCFLGCYVSLHRQWEMCNGAVLMPECKWTDNETPNLPQTWCKWAPNLPTWTLFRFCWCHESDSLCNIIFIMAVLIVSPWDGIQVKQLLLIFFNFYECSNLSNRIKFSHLGRSWNVRDMARSWSKKLYRRPFLPLFVLLPPTPSFDVFFNPNSVGLLAL